MGVRDTVASGQITEEFLDLTRTAATRVTRFRKSPTGTDWWSPEELDDLVFDMIARTTPASIVLAAQGSASDPQFSAWLRKALNTELLLRFRRTPLGKIVAAVDAALTEDPERFILAFEHWGLVGVDPPPVWDGGHAQLVAVARTVEAADIAVDRASTKTPPLARRKDIRAVSEAVLAVSGPLQKTPLARLHRDRFNSAFEEVPHSFDEGTAAANAPTMPSEDTSEARSAAQRMLAELSEEDRRVLLACLEETGGFRGIGEALGCGKFKAQALKERLEAKLLDLSADSDDPEESIRLLLELTRQTSELEHSLEQDGTNAD